MLHPSTRTLAHAPLSLSLAQVQRYSLDDDTLTTSFVALRDGQARPFGTTQWQKVFVAPNARA